MCAPGLSSRRRSANVCSYGFESSEVRQRRRSRRCQRVSSWRRETPGLLSDRTIEMSIRVLVVEDEKNLVALLRKYLEREGFEVHVALDGREAIEAAGLVEPDVVVLDWMLPGLDGIEVLRELRRSSEAYVIMLTARTEEVDRIVGLSTGADDYLTKPFSPGELVARIRAMLRRPRGDAREADEAVPLDFHELTIDPG